MTIGYVDVHDAVSGQILAHQDLLRQNFTLPMVFQNFNLSFYTSGTNNLEFRVYYYGGSYLEHAQTLISQIATYNSQDLLVDGNDPANAHQIGYASGTAWATDVTYGNGFMTYGPYAQAVPAGTSTATFNLEIDNNSADNDMVLQLTVNDATTMQVLATRAINRMDFAAPMTAQDFDLVFNLSTAGDKLEFRVYAYGIAYIKHLQTLMRPDRLTLNTLWSGNSNYQFQSRLPVSVDFMDTLDGVWYAFQRSTIALSNCSGSTALGTLVSKSTDRGLTWSPSVIVRQPSGSGPDACAITDGDAFFDPETDTWHMLIQCMSTDNIWNGCHYTRSGISPMGPFVPDPANPVIKSGQLWSQICAGSGKACSPSMGGEGTFQIVNKVNGYFYVTFHGYDGTHGARGVARTADFVNYQVSGADLPGNAILSTQDCQPWSVNWAMGGCIGEGNARTISSGGYNYILSEATDINLGCSAGQHWIFGLLRNSSWGSSGTWQNYRTNPYIVDQNTSPVGCALQYMSVFRDRGDFFLNFNFYNPSYYFSNFNYQLVSGPGPSQIQAK
jgi:hypothetical protein